jgi:hypothetical protein
MRPLILLTVLAIGLLIPACESKPATVTKPAPQYRRALPLPADPDGQFPTSRRVAPGVHLDGTEEQPNAVGHLPEGSAN